MGLKEQLEELEPAVTEALPIRDRDFVEQVSEEATLDEAEQIWPLLEASLDPKLGYGLAAIQIGIPKKVGFVRYNGKEYRLLNTRIVEKTNQTVMYGEGCLSIPGKHFNTVRYSNIVVADDMIGRVALDESSDGLLTIILQHEVDHFEGKTLYDRRQTPIVNSSKVGRNESCPCGSGKKYKKCCIH